MFFRPIKEGLRGISRHLGMSISSMLTVTITLLILSAFMIFSYHLNRFTKSFESTMEISVQIDYDYESEAMENEIRTAIEAIDGVKNVTYYSKDDELEFFLDSIEDEREKEIYMPFIGDKNPMHDSFYVETETGSQLEEIANQVRRIDGVFKVEYGGENTMAAVSAMINARRIGIIVVLIMVIMAIFLIQTTIQQTIMARVDEMRIMQDVGASNRFIRGPFVWEGIIIGIMGSIIPIAATIYLYKKLYDTTGGKILASMFTLTPPLPFLYYICAALVALGIFVGVFGSWTSVTRYLRAKR